MPCQHAWVLRDHIGRLVEANCQQATTNTFQVAQQAGTSLLKGFPLHMVDIKITQMAVFLLHLVLKFRASRT